MGYLTDGFARRIALAVDHTKLTGDVTNFPVCITWNGTTGNAPAELYNNSATSPLSTGADIRISTDIYGDTPCAIDLVTFTANSTVANARVELWFKLASISSSSDTTFYLWWGNANATAPGVTATYGRNAVWSNSFLAVYHMNEADLVDSTGNGYTATNSGTDAGTTTLGTARTFASGDYISIASLFGSPAQPTISALVICTGVASYAGEVFSMGDNINLRCRNNTTDGWRSSYRYATAWRDYLLDAFNPVGAGLFAGAFTVKTTATAAQVLYKGNGAADAVAGAYTDAVAYNQGTSTYWGRHGNGGGASFYFAGTIDETRVSSVARSTDWVAAEYQSTVYHATFVTGKANTVASNVNSIIYICTA